MSEEMNNNVGTKESGYSQKEEIPTMESQNNIAKAEELVKRMKEENDRFEELVKRNEAARVNSILAGKSEAGQQPEREETPQEYKERILRGGK